MTDVKFEIDRIVCCGRGMIPAKKMMIKQELIETSVHQLKDAGAPVILKGSAAAGKLRALSQKRPKKR